MNGAPAAGRRIPSGRGRMLASVLPASRFRALIAAALIAKLLGAGVAGAASRCRVWTSMLAASTRCVRLPVRCC